MVIQSEEMMKDEGEMKKFNVITWNEKIMKVKGKKAKASVVLLAEEK